MARNINNSNSSLDFIFRVPKRLGFNKLYRCYFDFILRLLYKAIEIKNVPETINETFLKMILYTQGKICFLDGVEVGETAAKLLALNCSRAAEPNVYYIPRQVLVTNPRLKKSYTLTPGEDCEVVYLSETDKYNMTEINGGLYILIERTATMLADNDISLNTAQKNTRLVNLIAADTQNTVDSVTAVISKMYEGDPTIVVKSSLIDKLQSVPIMQNTSSNSHLIELIEVNQYILAHFLEQIGICVHDQMKRERVITGELNDNLSFAFLSVDDIIDSLNAGFKKVNARWGTELEAVLNPIILEQRKQQEAAAAQTEEEPSEEEPAEEEPSEEEPAEEEPAEEEPAEEEPSEEEPAEEEPSEEEPAEEEPSEEEPAEEEPAEEEPAEEEPAEEEPAEEEPAEEEPAEEEPSEEEPPEDQTAENIEINIEGDNNTIIIQGGDDDGSTTENDAETLDDDSTDRI